MKVPQNHLGVGITYHPELAKDLLAHLSEIDFVECIADNFMESGVTSELRAISRHIPVVCHCLNISLGSYDSLDHNYLDRLERVFCDLEPIWISDHLAITCVQNTSLGH